MWIPESEGPWPHIPGDADRRLAVITSANALAEAMGYNKLMRGLYLIFVEKSGGVAPLFVKVSTHHYEGDGIQITPVDAYHLNQLGFLGKEDMRSSGGWGKTNYTRYFSWRMVDMLKLYNYLADETLPLPTEKVQST